ncbi:RDD family protein [Lutibacter sp.]|uniref:RDD family protein n=1 Tax=Lutibacter sp. TaxID=1925666 RepID=UPI0035678396
MNQIKIGRSSACDVVIADANSQVSRLHAIIEIRNNQYYIIDQSTNGTFINGIAIPNNSTLPINNGDIISLADEVTVSWLDITHLLPLQNKRETEVFKKENNAHTFSNPTIIYASWGSRLGAYILDCFFIGIIFAILFLGVGVYFAIDNNNLLEDLILYTYGILFIIIWLYYAILESGSNQGTWGKQIVKIKVVDVSTNTPITFAHSTGRFFSRLIIGFIPLFNLLDYLAPLWTIKKQTWHDNMSSCAVIEKH